MFFSKLKFFFGSLMEDIKRVVTKKFDLKKLDKSEK